MYYTIVTVIQKIFVLWGEHKHHFQVRTKLEHFDAGSQLRNKNTEP